MATDGVAYVFIERGGAFGFGHIGWGYRLADGRTVRFGSVQNVSGRPWVANAAQARQINQTAKAVSFGHWSPATSNNSGWSATGTEADMLRRMAHGRFRYDEYLRIAVPNARPQFADAVARGMAGHGYLLGHDTCLDNTYDILRQYGVEPRLLPVKQWSAPNWWFDRLKDNLGQKATSLH